MLENLVGKRYAVALSDSITEDSRLGAVLENLRSMCRAFETESQLSRFFAHPSIPHETKEAMVKELCDRLKVDETVRSILLMLTERKKILFLKNITEYFEGVVDQRLNQIRVSVCSAHPMRDENIEKLKTSLSRILGKTVLIDTRVDESLLGGILLNIGDRVADGTIRNRLAQLKQTIEKEEVA